MAVTGWHELVVTHGPAAWRTAYRLLGDAHEAEDCLQDAFLAAWELSRREPVRSWEGLLKYLATQRALDRLRRRRTRPDMTCDPGELGSLQTECPGPEELAQAAELAERLRQALATLPQRQAQVFCLCRLEDMNHREAAILMDLKPNAVAGVLHRARVRLRQLLGSAAKEQD